MSLLDEFDWQKWSAELKGAVADVTKATSEFFYEYRERGLRDEFAKAALTGDLVSAQHICSVCAQHAATTPAEFAKNAYEYADAMMLERDRRAAAGAGDAGISAGRTDGEQR